MSAKARRTSEPADAEIVSKTIIGSLLNEKNVLIAMDPTDTLEQVSAVLRFLSEVRPLDGIVPDEQYEWGRSQILMACENALRAAHGKLLAEDAPPAPVSIRTPGGGRHVQG
ncbi:MAG: hypothetical protein AMXMBFR8_26840 [Nevskiales bacterium]